MLARALSRGPTDLQALNSELGREYRAHRDAHRGARAVSDHAVAAAAPQEGNDPITLILNRNRNPNPNPNPNANPNPSPSPTRREEEGSEREGK